MQTAGWRRLQMGQRVGERQRHCMYAIIQYGRARAWLFWAILCIWFSVKVLNIHDWFQDKGTFWNADTNAELRSSCF